MLAHINMQSEVPIYRQLKTQIVQGILTGALQEGDHLPSVRQLGCDLGINLHTVRKAYTMLKEEGYISIYRNQLAVVSKPPHIQKQDLTDFFKALFPIVIEMRARDITKTQFDELLDSIWEQSITGGKV